MNDWRAEATLSTIIQYRSPDYFQTKAMCFQKNKLGSILESLLFSSVKSPTKSQTNYNH